MKVDVAIQSYMKPESLLYTLMTLKEHSEGLIDTVFINDDCSPDAVIKKYTSDTVKSHFHKWKIYTRKNTHRAGWWQGVVFGYWPKYLKLRPFLAKTKRNLSQHHRIFCRRHNIRYQWALDTTDKKYLFTIHDDMEFRKNVLQEYIAFAEQLTNPAIIGDLGQCWVCPYQSEPFFCTPDKIMHGQYPSAIWPITDCKASNAMRACRINEWCCLLSVEAAVNILKTERVFFGNYDDNGDIGAYWFERAIALGYSFGDPFPDFQDRLKYYVHGWQEFSGHSVWVDQGCGKSTYNKHLIEQRMQEKYGIVLS
jgi:hypothetical protein